MSSKTPSEQAAENCIRELEKLGHLDFDGGEQNERATLVLDLVKIIGSVTCPCWEKLRAALEWYANAECPDDGSGRPPEAFQRRASEALAKSCPCPQVNGGGEWKLTKIKGNPGAADWGEIDFGNGKTHRLLWHDAKVIHSKHNATLRHQPAPVEAIARIQAHRAVHSAEHDPANGKLHGYCIVCGVPFPCQYVGQPPAPVEAWRDLLGEERVESDRQLFKMTAAGLMKPIWQRRVGVALKEEK